jgi:hypothetical protein
VIEQVKMLRTWQDPNGVDDPLKFYDRHEITTFSVLVTAFPLDTWTNPDLFWTFCELILTRTCPAVNNYGERIEYHRNGREK